MSTPPKPLPRSVLFIVAALALFTSGCAFRQKTSTRIRSFEPHAGRHIGSTEIRTFLSARVSVLVSGNPLPMPEWRKGILRFPREINWGCAAAIDRRGYFLTASHCIEREQKTVYLLSPGPEGKIWLQRARVVWQGDWENGEPDLTVLHVFGMRDHVFDWAETVHEREPVMAVGMSLSEENRFQGLEYLGGKIVDYGERKGKRKIVGVIHDVPIQSGDSGGPLVNAEARLIGINVEGTPPLAHFLGLDSVFSTVAERPDPKWLANIIEKDAAARQPTDSPPDIFLLSPSKPPRS